MKEQQERDDKLRLEKEKEDQDKLRAPHLTNLNEDIQLSGKMYYSLKDVFHQDVHIGRQDGDPVPQIILRGVGIQENHAHIKLCPNGMFKIVVIGKDAWEQTMVNGKRLALEGQADEDDSEGSDNNMFGMMLHHLDRIFIGMNTLFLFKYPLMHIQKQEMAKQRGFELASAN